MHKSLRMFTVVVAVVLALGVTGCPGGGDASPAEAVADTVMISASLTDSVIIIVTGTTASVGGTSTTFHNGKFLVKRQ